MQGLFGEYIEPHTDEWYAARLGKITASEVDKLFVGGRKKDEFFGKGALTYLDIKIAEIFTGEAKEARGIPIDWGLSNEHDAALHYENLTGYKTEHCGLYLHPEIHLLAGTPDREIPETRSILEVKCPYASENHIKIMKMKSVEELREFDLTYYAQPQTNLFITGAAFCDFVSYDPRVKNPDFRMKIFRIYPDRFFHDELVDRLGEAAAIMNASIEEMLLMPERHKNYLSEGKKQLLLT